MNSSLLILAGLLIGLGGGILFSEVEPELLGSLPAWISPIGELWVNGIRMTVVPLLMALVITAVAGEARSTTVSSLGRRTLGLLVLLIAAASMLTLLLAPPLLGLISIDPVASRTLLENTGLTEASVADLPPFSDWLVNLVPANPVLAAADTAILPLMVFTGLFALALLYIPAESRIQVVGFFQAIHRMPCLY